MKLDHLLKGIAALVIFVPVVMFFGESLLSRLFPPKMGCIHARLQYRANGAFPEEDLGDGIIWRAYDVRATGIEKMYWRNLR